MSQILQLINFNQLTLIEEEHKLRAVTFSVYVDPDILLIIILLS
jgi:hypothetical protein